LRRPCGHEVEEGFGTREAQGGAAVSVYRTIDSHDGGSILGDEVASQGYDVSLVLVPGGPVSDSHETIARSIDRRPHDERNIAQRRSYGTKTFY
jgi:hypothetical protein